MATEAIANNDVAFHPDQLSVRVTGMQAMASPIWLERSMAEVKIGLPNYSEGKAPGGRDDVSRDNSGTHVSCLRRGPECGNADRFLPVLL